MIPAWGCKDKDNVSSDDLVLHSGSIPWNSDSGRLGRVEIDGYERVPVTAQHVLDD